MKFKTAGKRGGMVVELGAKEKGLPAVAPAPFQLKKILVPVDFSECSAKALEYALPLARQFSAEITLVHVLESYPSGFEVDGSTLALLESQLRDDAARRLEKIRLTLPDGVARKAELRIGNPQVEIIAAARATAADLIVVSTHGRTGLAHVFLGSVAENIVRHASCPVLVVREKERDFVEARK